jgi:hypothetical protein
MWKFFLYSLGDVIVLLLMTSQLPVVGCSDKFRQNEIKTKLPLCDHINAVRILEWRWIQQN